MRARIFFAAVLVLACATAACSKRGANAGSPGVTHVAGTPHPDDVLDTIKDAGLRAEGFAPLQPVPYGAVYCEQGRIEGIDTLICEFADDTTLAQGRRLVQEEWGREGVQTGVATIAKHTLLGVADRGHHDPNGKTISRILTAFHSLQKN